MSALQQSSNKDKALSHIDNALDHASSRLNSTRQWATSQASSVLDKTITPEQRKQLTSRTQDFAQTNPKLTAFIVVNLILTGIPVLFFLGFSLSVLLFSLATGIIIGTVSALIFTATTVGFSLLLLLPTVFFTTIAAAFLFFWGALAITALQYSSKRRSSPKHLNGAALNGQTRSRISQSAESAPKPDREVVRFSEPQQSDLSFDFDRKPKGPPMAFNTALPADKKLTDHVKVESNKPAIVKIVNVPTEETTGMMAS